MVKVLINGKNCENSINTNQQRDSPQEINHESNVDRSLLQLNEAVKAKLNKMDQLVGLTEVKQTVYEICAYIAIQRKRRQLGLKTESQALHMLFTGSPGTGKTTIARILGEIFNEMDYLPQGHLIEVERADLVGEYIGQTAQKTKRQINKALGGILFVDEAYSLARGGSTDFGKEAIDALVKATEDYKDQLIVILAGYRSEMQYFLTSNPGITSRFPIQINFPNYTEDELLSIAEQMLTEREYQLSSGAKTYLEAIIDRKLTEEEQNFSNARFVRNMLEQSIRKQAMRLIKQNYITRDDLIYLTKTDLRCDYD